MGNFSYPDRGPVMGGRTWKMDETAPPGPPLPQKARYQLMFKQSELSAVLLTDDLSLVSAIEGLPYILQLKALDSWKPEGYLVYALRFRPLYHWREITAHLTAVLGDGGIVEEQ